MADINKPRRFVVGLSTFLTIRQLLEKGWVLDGVFVDGAGDVYFKCDGETYRVNVVGTLHIQVGETQVATRQEISRTHMRTQ